MLYLILRQQNVQMMYQVYIQKEKVQHHDPIHVMKAVALIGSSSS